MSRVKQQLRLLRNHPSINPRDAWLEKNKQALLRTISVDEPVVVRNSFTQKIESIIQALVPSRALLAIQRGGIIALTVIVTAYGWGVSVSAAQNSLPGDLLYNVKLAEEKRELFVAASEKEKVELALGHASKRAGELKQIKETSNTVEKKEKQTKVVVDALKKNIELASEELQKVKSTGDVTTAAAAVAVVVEEKTQELVRDLTESPASTDGASGVNEAVSMAVDTNVQASLVVAEVLLAPREGTSVPETVVPLGKDAEDVIGEHLEKTVATLEQHLVELATVPVPFDTTSGSMMQSIAPASSSTTSSTPSTTPVVSVSTSSLVSSSVVLSSSTSLSSPVTVSSSQTSTVSSTPVQAGLTTVAEAEAVLLQAKSSLLSQDLQTALQKIQELYVLAKSAQAEAGESSQTIVTYTKESYTAPSSTPLTVSTTTPSTTSQSPTLAPPARE